MALVFTGNEEPDGFDVCGVFLLEDAGGEGLGGVAIENGNLSLNDNWAGVQFLIDEVDAATGTAIAVGEYTFVDI